MNRKNESLYVTSITEALGIFEGIANNTLDVV
jgi:hypothetical protein